MPKFGSASKAHRAELVPDLQRLVDAVIEHWDFSILDAGRTIEEQRKNVARGVSKTMASRHLFNAQGKAEAFDAMPYPNDWAKIQRGLDAVKRAEPTMQVCRAYMFSGFVAGMAAAMKIKIRQGSDWDGDRQVGDHTFIDLPHTELLK